MGKPNSSRGGDKSYLSPLGMKSVCKEKPRKAEPKEDKVEEEGGL